MRFIEPLRGSTDKPIYGDTFCIVGDSVRFYRSSDMSLRRQYFEYKKLDSSFAELAQVGFGHSYQGDSPCENRTTYTLEQAKYFTPTTFSASVVTSALLCLSLVCALVWACIHRIFPTTLRIHRTR